MIKIKSDSKVTSFGGIHLIHSQVKAIKLDDFIGQQLGQRKVNSKYSFADMIISRLYTDLCGGECAEDIYFLEQTLEHLKGLRTPSADTILRLEGELSVPNIELTSTNQVINQLNINEQLNRFLVNTATFLKMLTPDQSGYCLDFDHQVIPTEKQDSTYSYKEQRGYFPGVASINNVPVYVENRNGNSSVKFNQLDTLRRIFAQLAQSGITPEHCRMDCGSYIKEVCDWLHNEQRCNFYIRANQSHQLLVKASESTDWQDIKMGKNHYQATSIKHEFGQNTYRVVCYRWPNKNGQVNISTNDAYSYLFIITNNRVWSEKQVIKFYNDRGNSERLFDIQNNDFNWKKMPHSYMPANTVYLIIMAACHTIYQWLVRLLSQHLPVIRPGHRLKKFIFRIISIAAKVTRSGRQQVVRLFTNLPIKHLLDRAP